MEREVRRRRQRTPLACVPCRRRKIRCDRKWPCSNCVTASQVCAFDVAEASSAVRFPEREMRNDHPSRPQQPVAEGITLSGSTPVSPGGSGPNGNAVSDSHCQDPEVMSYTAPLDETSQAILQRRSGLEKPRIHLNKTRTLRFSHCMALADEVAPIKAFFTDCRRSIQPAAEGEASQGGDLSSLALGTAEFLQKCKYLARSRKAYRPSLCLSNADLALRFSSKEAADKMVSLYLRNFESTHRIVHIPTFNALYSEFWDNPGKPASREVRLLVHLVAVVGSSHWLEGETTVDVRNEADHVVYAAQVWLAEPVPKHRFTIVGLQIYCLVILARTLFTLGGDLTWASAGDLLHRAMQMGLHRDPDYLPEMSILEAETRRRLWATILEIVLQSSLDSAMSARVSVEDFDTRAPANVNDVDLGFETRDIEPRQMTEYTNTSTQLLLCSTIPVRLRALHLSFHLHTELSYREALVLESDLVEASRVARKFLEDHKVDGATSLNRNMVDYMLQRFLILLHFPFSMEASRDPLFAHSAQVCIDAGMTVLYPEADQVFTCRLTHAGGMYREGLRMAVWVFSLPLLALMEHYSHDTAPHDRLLRLHFLRSACEDMVALARRRIEHGRELHINTHLFLSMVQAQIEAMHRGTNVNLAIAQAARDSARSCYQMLCAHNPVSSAIPQHFITTSLQTEADPSLGNSIDIDFDDFLSPELFEF